MEMKGWGWVSETGLVQCMLGEWPWSTRGVGGGGGRGGEGGGG